MKITILCHKTYRFTEHVVVESDSKMEPHYVTIAKSGKITCNDCPMWKAQKICAHSLAVAEKSGMTASFLNWFKEKGPTRVNLTALMTCDSTKGVGKKGGKPATARRKGGRTLSTKHHAQRL